MVVSTNKKMSRAEAEFAVANAIAAAGASSVTEFKSRFMTCFSKSFRGRTEEDGKGNVWRIKESIYPAKAIADIAVSAGVVSDDGVPVGHVVEERVKVEKNLARF